MPSEAEGHQQMGGPSLICYRGWGVVADISTMACEGLWGSISIKDVTFRNEFLSSSYQLLNLGRLQILADLSSLFFCIQVVKENLHHL